MDVTIEKERNQRKMDLFEKAAALANDYIGLYFAVSYGAKVPLQDVANLTERIKRVHDQLKREEESG